jgi:hypothetical protein
MKLSMLKLSGPSVRGIIFAISIIFIMYFVPLSLPQHFRTSASVPNSVTAPSYVSYYCLLNRGLWRMQTVLSHRQELYIKALRVIYLTLMTKKKITSCRSVWAYYSNSRKALAISVIVEISKD